MSASNAAKGQRAKAKTKQWLERQGYVVALLERVMWIPRAGRPIPIKRDQMGADLLAVNDCNILFVQVKSFGTLDRRNALTVKTALTEFAKYPCPSPAKQVVLAWHKGERLPRLTYRVDSTVGGSTTNGTREEGVCIHDAGAPEGSCREGRTEGASERRGAPMDIEGSGSRRTQGRHRTRQTSA